LSALASIQRNLQDYARTDPRLAQTDKERGEISAAGQNTRYNSITIDGVTTNDTFGLESNNLPTLKQPISIDAIDSVQVNISNYDVTQKGYTGANINAVTKSGTNDLKGSLYYAWRNDQFAGQRYNRVTNTTFDPPKSRDATVGFTLGGPVIKDKLFFFSAYEEYKSNRTRPNFGPIGSAATNVGITPQMITDVISVARNTWGMDIGTGDIPGNVQVVVKDALLKLDWNISDDHRASLRYTKTDQTEPIITATSMFSANNLSLSSFWYNQVKTVESVVGQWFADWSPRFSTELKLSSRDYDSVPTPVNGTRLPQITMRYAGALPAGSPAGTNANSRDLNFGTERSRHFNVLRTKTVDGYLGATWVRGDHEVKFGADFAQNDIYNAFLQDTNGQYRFQCENGTYSFQATAVNCTTASADVVAAAALENFRLGRPSLYQVQLPLAGRSINDAVAVWSYTNTGLFLQDNFKLNDRLSVMLGVRMDQQGVPTKPLRNAAVAAARETWRVNGDDRAYMAAVYAACDAARRTLEDACLDPVDSSRGMGIVATAIAAPYSLERYIRAARDEVFAAMRLRARAAVGAEVCERIYAVHAATQQRIDAARDAYRAGGTQRDYLDAIRVEVREAQREQVFAELQRWLDARF
jgi:hypothetical protein